MRLTARPEMVAGGTGRVCARDGVQIGAAGAGVLSKMELADKCDATAGRGEREVYKGAVGRGYIMILV